MDSTVKGLGCDMFIFPLFSLSPYLQVFLKPVHKSGFCCHEGGGS